MKTGSIINTCEMGHRNCAGKPSPPSFSKEHGGGANMAHAAAELDALGVVRCSKGTATCSGGVGCSVLDVDTKALSDGARYGAS